MRVTLAARVVALLLLAAAFARPYVASAMRGSSLRIVAIDRSYSMNAPGRFALPPTRVEAMYSPAIRAQVPNAPMTIWAR